jgi:hypothetical protein
MQLDLSPEPTPQERDAIAAAIGELVEPPEAAVKALYESPWRLAGLRENATNAPT